MEWLDAFIFDLELYGFFEVDSSYPDEQAAVDELLKYQIVKKIPFSPNDLNRYTYFHDDKE